MSRPELPRPARRALHRRQPAGRRWLVIGSALTGLSFAHATLAAGKLPQGGTYVAGAGAIASQGNGLVVTQPGSTRGVIEWNSFSIGRNNSVTFDNGSGATLNRVTGGSPSAIFGRLSATGSLYVINPQGIVVGPSGVISTGGRFVASTLDVCNDAFMQGGGSLTLSGDPNASVINLGKISSSSGDVFLIARGAVINAGTIAAPNGTAELAAGKQVLLQDSGSSRQVFVQMGSQGTVVNRGHIKAAQVSLQAADGNVYALAGGGTRIRATGTANRDGHVWLVADGGRVSQLGKIAASNADGSGGTVDTQAAQLAFGKHAAVHAGQWNLLTPAFTIDDAAARALQRSLNAGTSIDVTTTGANGATGDLGIASSLNWSGPASLTLAAYHNVSVTTGTTIANNGAGNLALRSDASGIDNGGSVINNGTIDWSKSTGIVSTLYDMNGSYSPGTLVGNAAWSAPLYSGLVTQITGYQLVNSVTDLQSIENNLAGNYALGKDIDGSNVAFTTFAFDFTGQFDGMWHTISNVLPSDFAIFGEIGATGVVRDVNVKSNVSTTANNLSYAGILAVYNYGMIANVFTSGAIVSETSGSTDWFAGLVFENDGLIARSGSSATVRAGVAGGLVINNGGTITESYTTGSVTADNVFGYAGGLAVTNADHGTITQSFATGPVSSASIFVGGICGYPGCVGIGSDVYWNVQTTGQSSGGGNLPASNGLTTAQMSAPASFVGWDFGPSGAWTMPPGATHPVLTWQVTGQ
ncbi:filamentous hemagglutinin N-terminal domain-containing protein [Paraburkholderia sp. UCT31]|uniref:two-partner secretion domain-containing protein n=1 Tax=Paraburkholderia sp. UCT31 TaxID=2615209 RepID=UPI0016553EFB|nr:filamentous hemagglutinin N-terminal domain-containing protein [Paraburkholderia sp. UCT31]MBC8735731.1 filamentous hemagglutinin N-terminal domain-containing protein [Paraburkholderia sp. UCT31]